MVGLQRLIQDLDRLLDPDTMDDHGPNGLQVEGRPDVKKVVTAVTASQNAIDHAAAAGADALVVHHGLFWGGAVPLVGWMGRRVRALMHHDLSLIAYHLPLDVHPVLGNNALLLDALGLRSEGRFGPADIGMWGRFDAPRPAAEIVRVLAEVVGQEPVLLGGGGDVGTVGVVTGAGQRYFEDAIRAGCDLFVTGEASEYVTHVARETGVHYAWAGHHATEKAGVQALGRHLHETYGIEVSFFDDPNPV